MTTTRRLSIKHMSEGGRVWASARVLCSWLLQQDLQGQDVLELGCGTGACGLFAAALGAQRVTLTDGGAPALLSLASKNAINNRYIWAARGAEVRVEHHKWGEWVESASFRGHDWILGSDLTYASHSHQPLCDSLAAQLRHFSPQAHAILAHQQRIDPQQGECADERLQGFIAAASSFDLEVSVAHSEFVDGGRLITLLRVEDAR